MPPDIWTAVADRAAARRAGTIPADCSCTWVPDYSTLPATWWLPAQNVSSGCKAHGSKDGDQT